MQFEGLRVIGDPHEFALRYAGEADELLYIDTVASLYGRNNLIQIVERTTSEIFIPVTVGGGIKSVRDVQDLLAAGADKVAVNTAALADPSLVGAIAARYGNQALVVSIEAKRVADGWEAYTEAGRQRTGVDAVAWAFEAVRRGAGELLVTSIDQDGTMRGFDVDLIRAIAPNVPVPVIAAGGMGALEHLQRVIREGKADAVAMASCLHYGRVSLREARTWDA